MYCTKCGTPLSNQMNACPNCGKRIGSEDNTPTYQSIHVPYPSPEAPPPPQPTMQSNPYTPYTTPYNTTQSTYPSSQPQPATRRLHPLWIVAIVALLLLIGGGGLLIALINNDTSTIHTTSTTTPTAQATSANQSLYLSATSGTPTINDPLSSEGSSSWISYKAVSPDKGGCSFQAGAFHVTEMAPHRFVYCSPPGTFSNFAFQISMTIVSGGNGGFIFRDNEKTNQFYTLRINSAGAYAVDTFTAPGVAQPLQHGTIDNFHTGYNQANLLTLIASNSQFSVYINKQFVTNMHDSTYSDGRLGLIADDVQDQTVVSYSNAQIWRLP